MRFKKTFSIILSLILVCSPQIPVKAEENYDSLESVLENLPVEEHEDFLSYLEDQSLYDDPDYMPPSYSSRAYDSRVFHDLRVGSLFVGLDSCSASQITDNWWITAAHCISNTSDNGFITRQNGHFAGIEKIFKHPSADIALVRVGEGLRLSSPKYSISNELPSKDSTLFFMGYGGRYVYRDSPTSATVKTEYANDQRIKTYGVTSNDATCKGDSGASLRSGDTIVGIVSAIYPDSRYKSKLNYCSPVTSSIPVSPYKGWIDDVIAHNNNRGWSERVRSYTGGKLFYAYKAGKLIVNVVALPIARGR